MRQQHSIRTLAATLALAAFVAFAVAPPLLAQQSQPASQTKKPTGPERWEPAIAEFEKWDRKNSTPRDAVLFVGSSSIVGWKSAADFPEFPVINRGFGGSEIEDSTHFAPRIIDPYRPRVIVLYAGDNDLAAGKSSERVLADFKAFVAKVRSFAPRTPIVYLSIKPSRSRWHLWPIARATNESIAAECKNASDDRLHYVDVATPLLDAKTGEPIDDLFVGDKLHVSAAGYAKWNEVLRPVLAKLMAQSSNP